MLDLAIRSGKWTLASLALAWASVAAPAGAACLDVPGDINGDGETNITDVQCMIQAGIWNYYGQVDSAPTCLAVSVADADQDCDGSAEQTIDFLDVQITILLSLGIPLPPSMDSDGDDCVDGCFVPCPEVPAGAGATWETPGKIFTRFTWGQAAVGNNGRANANSFCVGSGGSLARPNSQAEWDSLRTNLPQDSMGYWMDGHNNFTCGTATPGSPKSYQYGFMYCPAGQSSLYTGCNCSTSEQGLVAYRSNGSSPFDGCQGGGGTTTGMLGVMDEDTTYAHSGIAGFVCEFECASAGQ